MVLSEDDVEWRHRHCRWELSWAQRSVREVRSDTTGRALVELSVASVALWVSVISEGEDCVDSWPSHSLGGNHYQSLRLFPLI